MLAFFMVSFALSPCGFSRASSEPVRPGVNGVGYPACVYCPRPGLPEGSRNLKDHVVVVLIGVIQTNGRAASIQIVKSGGTGFDEEALGTVRRWRFKPAIGPNGKPVSVTTHIEVRWN
jgi:TonB family protein